MVKPTRVVMLTVGVTVSHVTSECGNKGKSCPPTHVSGLEIRFLLEISDGISDLDT